MRAWWRSPEAQIFGAFECRGESELYILHLSFRLVSPPWDFHAAGNRVDHPQLAAPRPRGETLSARAPRDGEHTRKTVADAGLDLAYGTCMGDLKEYEVVRSPKAMLVCKSNGGRGVETRSHVGTVGCSVT